jgi:hypothetical protein
MHDYKQSNVSGGSLFSNAMVKMGIFPGVESSFISLHRLEDWELFGRKGTSSPKSQKPNAVNRFDKIAAV